MKKYVLTGGPGSGKSSILLELERRGEYVVRESAEDQIKLYQGKGIEKPWLEDDFQDNLLELQLRRESLIPPHADRVWLDRGVLDNFAYISDYNPRMEAAAEKADYESIVFLVENLGSCDTNRVRRERQSEALELERKLENTYRSRGYKIVRVPPIGIENRANYILNHLES